MKYAADILILTALVLLAIGIGILSSSAAAACFVAAGGCAALGLWIGLRGGDA